MLKVTLHRITSDESQPTAVGRVASQDLVSGIDAARVLVRGSVLQYPDPLRCFVQVGERITQEVLPPEVVQADDMLERLLADVGMPHAYLGSLLPMPEDWTVGLALASPAAAPALSCDGEPAAGEATPTPGYPMSVDLSRG